MYRLYTTVFGQNGRSLLGESEHPIMLNMYSDNVIVFYDEPPEGTENAISGYINRESIVSVVVDKE